MRVLHITTNYPTPEYPIFGIFVKEQVESLEKLGIECDVMYCDRRGRGTWSYFTYIPKVFLKVIKGNYDVIHCHHVLSALILSCTFIPLFKKCIVSYQNDPTTEWKLNVFNFIHLFFNAIILKNRSEYLGRTRTIYLPNGCNQDFFRPMDKAVCRDRLGLDRDAVYFLFMDSNKGVRTQKRKDRFDRTIEILRDRYGYRDIRTLELRNTPRELIPEYINACDLHLLSSDFEGSPNSVKECMCCNVPVVSTDVGNVREMIGNIDGAYVVDEMTAEALATACDKVLKADKPFEAREKFLSSGYGMADVAEKLSRLYSDISN